MGQRALEVEQKITIPAAMIKEVRTRYEMAKPIYLVMDEWAPYGRDVFVDCEKFKATDFYKDIPYLDVTSSYSKDTKTMVINVVNRHKDNAISTEIISSSGDFAGKAAASELSIADYKAPLTYDKKDQYVPVVKEVAVKGNSMTYSFPAHSFTQIIVKTVN